MATVLVSFSIPGAWLIACWFDEDHPLAWAPAVPAVSTVLALAPFAVASLFATFVHADVEVVVELHVVLTVALALCAARAGRAADDAPIEAVAAVARRRPWWALFGIALLGAGLVALAQLKRSNAFAVFRSRWFAGVELGDVSATWWWGIPVAAIGAGIAGIAWSRRRDPSLGTAAHVLAWVACIACVAWAARVAFALPPAGAAARGPWDYDDVTYVAEALDAAAGLPLGWWEPTLGAELGRVRSSVSVLWAPWVAMASRVTAIEPAALHHSVLPPLLVVWFASATLGLLRSTLGRRPLAAPLGTAAFFIAVCASWDYAANLGQYLVLQAAQPKSLHLGLLHPLQIATTIRLATRGHRGDLAAAVAVAVVAHAVHPFAAICGALWTAVALLVALAHGERRPIGALVGLLACYGLAGLEVWLGSRHPELPLELTDRSAGEIREARDLLRDSSGQPRSTADARLIFGADLVTAWAMLAVPLALFAARRDRQLRYVAAFAAAAIAACFLPAVADAVMVALHPAILWRARWFIPAAPLVALSIVVLFEAAVHVLPGGRRAAPLAVVLVLVGEVAMLRWAHGRRLDPGDSPLALDKLSPRGRMVASTLGPDCAAFVWTAGSLALELPQLLPHVQLAMSRPKTMRPPASGNAATLRGLWTAFAGRDWTDRDLAQLRMQYPVDLIALESRDHRGRTTLFDSGWQPVAEIEGVALWQPPDHRARLRHCLDAEKTRVARSG